MALVLSPRFIARNCYHWVLVLLILLLLAGPGSTSSVPRAGRRARARPRGSEGRRGRLGAESRDRPGEVRDGDKARIGAADTETRPEGTGATSRPKTEATKDHRVTEHLRTSLGGPPVVSIGGEDGQRWEPRSPSRCVPVPPRMALCQGIGYEAMRMPNLLGHESPAEAVQQSASWLPLLSRECHPDARIFLCSLFAPICLDRLVSPCRSLCESVRDSCAPIMGCYGYPWPDILRCEQFPADDQLCISSITNSSVSSGPRRVPQASCMDCELEEASSSKDTLDTFCRSDFVVKLRLTRLKFSPASMAQFSLASKLEVLKHGPLLGGQIRSRMELWLERDATCVRNMTRRQPRGGTFLVTGTVQGERLVVNKAYVWQKRDKNLVAAARKWKRHRCAVN